MKIMILIKKVYLVWIFKIKVNFVLNMIQKLIYKINKVFLIIKIA